MTQISLSKYVDISSVKQGGSAVPRRELVARIMTDSEFIQTGGVTSFSSLEAVAAYFSTADEEYMRASFNFAFISKIATSPSSFQLARWVSADVECKIFGSRDAKSLGDFTSITDGSMLITIAGESRSLTGLDFSSDLSLSAVATNLQTAIASAGSSQFTGATVVYNPTTSSFDFVSGDTGPATISVFEGTVGTPVAGLFGWTDLSTIVSDGANAQTPVEAVSGSAEVSNNFGSVGFLTSFAWSLDEITEISEWISAQNVAYQFHVGVTEANALSYSNALANFAGTGLTLRYQGAGNPEYHEMMPMVILASTPYDRLNSVQNYMYYQAALTPTVSDDATADQLDALRVNYYGRTKSAGVNIDFYQRGYLMGGSTAPINMNVFANEQWFKDAVGSDLMNLMLTQRIPSNKEGRDSISSVISNGPVVEAKDNGAISVGRELNQTQIQLVSSVTGNPLAYQEIEAIGYWLDVSIVPVTVNGNAEFEANYILMYASDQIVRKINGSHILL